MRVAVAPCLKPGLGERHCSSADTLRNALPCYSPQPLLFFPFLVHADTHVYYRYDYVRSCRESTRLPSPLRLRRSSLQFHTAHIVHVVLVTPSHTITRTTIVTSPHRSIRHPTCRCCTHGVPRVPSARSSRAGFPSGHVGPPNRCPPLSTHYIVHCKFLRALAVIVCPGRVETCKDFPSNRFIGGVCRRKYRHGSG